MATTIEDRVALLEAQVFELQHRTGWVDEMTTQQGLRHDSFRAIGGTAGTYEGDARAAFEVEATIPAGATFNEAFILWLQARLSSTETNLQNLMQAFAEQEGAHNWSTLGTFGAASTSLEVSIAASEDDAVETISTTAVSISGNTAGFNLSNIIGFRFLVPTLPQGATIVSANIQFTAASTTAGDTAFTIWCEDADASAAFQAANADISGRTLTTASAAWSPGDWTSGDRLAAQLTSDLAAPVQEVVDRVGFDGVLTFIGQRTGGASNRTVASWDNATLQEATLTVVYA